MSLPLWASTISQTSWLNGQGGPIDSALREYLTVPGVSAVRVPKESPQSFTEWSTLVVTGVTAWNALYGNIPLKSGHVANQLLQMIEQYSRFAFGRDREACEVARLPQGYYTIALTAN